MKSVTRPRSRPALEPLERRDAPAVTPLPEFQVNQYTSGPQTFPSVGMTADGRVVLAWQSIGSDGSGIRVNARLYAADGSPLSGEFQVSQGPYIVSSLAVESHPSVGVSPYGDFVIAWASDGQDGSGDGVYARRYAADGTPLGNEFQVNQYTDRDQSHPSVGMAADGSAVVVWQSQNQDGSGDGVYARRYAADGTPLGNEFQVNQYTLRSQWLPSVGVAPGGEFVVAWACVRPDLHNDVYARRYGADGTPLGDEFLVNQHTENDQWVPSVGVGPGGEFVVAWESDGQDGDTFGVYARRYAADGIASGGEFQVNQTWADWQASTSVGVGPDGGCVVAWVSNGQDGSDYGIYVRRYGADGTPLGGEFQGNQYTTDYQVNPSVGVGPGGDFVVAWQDGEWWTGQSHDGSYAGVFARLFVNNTAPTAAGFTPVSVPEDSPPTLIDLSAVIADAESGPSGLTYQVVANSNPALVPSVTFAGTGMTIAFAPDENGEVAVTVRATDPRGWFAEATLAVTVRPVNDTPRLLVGGRPDGTAVGYPPADRVFPDAVAVSFFPGAVVTVRTAAADVTGDGVPDLIGGAGPGGSPAVRVLDGATQAELASFFAFEPGFTGGVFVAAADLDGDGRAEVVVTPDEGGGPVVAVFDGAGAERGRFLGIDDPNFRGGARPALGDVSGDGTPDLVVAAGSGGGPRVAVFDGKTLSGTPARLVPDFFALETTLLNGAFVAAGDVTGDGRADVAFGGGPGGAPRVRLFDGKALLAAGPFATLDAVPSAQRADYFAGDSALRGGVRLSLKDADGDGRADLLAGTGEGEPSRVRVYVAANLLASAAPAPDQDLDPFGEVLADGVFVG